LLEAASVEGNHPLFVLSHCLQLLQLLVTVLAVPPLHLFRGFLLHIGDPLVDVFILEGFLRTSDKKAASVQCQLLVLCQHLHHYFLQQIKERCLQPFTSILSLQAFIALTIKCKIKLFLRKRHWYLHTNTSKTQGIVNVFEDVEIFTSGFLCRRDTTTFSCSS
jgi:hypothetical protein